MVQFAIEEPMCLQDDSRTYSVFVARVLLHEWVRKAQSPERAVPKWTGVGGMHYPLGGDQALTRIPATNDLYREIGIDCKQSFCIVGDGLLSGKNLAYAGSAVCCVLSI